MSLHSGDLAENVRPDAMGQRDTEDSLEMRRSTTGFVAINNELPSFRPRFVPFSHQRRGIDSDKIYDLPDDVDTSESGFEINPEQHFIQKRKDHVSSSPIAKRHAEARDSQPEPDIHKEYNVESGAVTTDQRSSSKYRATSASKQAPYLHQQRHTSGKTRLFSNVPIQKASVEVSRAGFKISGSPATPSLHRGVITTQDKLKACPDKVSKTALAKLASFRYKEAFPGQTDIWSKHTINQHTGNQDLGQSRPEKAFVAQPALNFSEVGDVIATPFDVNPGVDIEDEHVSMWPEPEPEYEDEICLDSSNIKVPSQSSMPVREQMQVHITSNHSTRESIITAEKKKPSNDPQYPMRIAEERVRFPDAKSSTSHVPNRFHSADHPDNQSHAKVYQHQHGSIQQDHSLLIQAQQQSGAEAESGCNLHTVLHNTDEQDVVFIATEGSGYHSIDDGSDDDFDENLDERDLLVLMSEVEARLPSSHVPCSSSAACIPRWSPSSSRILSGQGDQQPADGGHLDRSTMDDSSHEVICLSDDEGDLFPDEDEEMLDLSPFPGVVTETFHPPSSAYPQADSSDGEIYDSSLQYSEPNSLSTAARAPVPSTGISTDLSSRLHITKDISLISDTDPGLLDDHVEMDWEFVKFIPGRAQQHISGPGTVIDQRQSSVLKLTDTAYEVPPSFQVPASVDSKTRVGQAQSPGQNTEKHQPLKPFGRPNFPARIRDRSPIIGLTSSVLLRVCFRVGEAFLAGGQCASTKQNAIIELYARVTFSSREEGTVKQHFQFRDLFYDRPPYLNGILENYRSRDLVNRESRVFVGENGKGKMVRCLGRLKGDTKKSWKMLIDNVRETDWEEVQHTRRVLTEGWVKEKFKGTV